MTIAEKLQLIADAKENIRQSLGDIGITVQSDTPFSEYSTIIESSAPKKYTRDESWIELPDIQPVAGEAGNVIYGLVLLSESRNKTVTIYAQGDYTVDWGDGTVENYETNTVCSHTYDIDSISSNLTSNGEKQVIFTIRPQPSKRLTRFESRQNNDKTFCDAVVDIRMSGDDFRQIRLSAFIGLELYEFVGTNDISDASYMFMNCYSLRKVTSIDIGSASTTRNMFYNCYSLEEIPPLDTKYVTSFYAMFGGCTSLKKVEGLDTSNAIQTSGMFNGCYALEVVQDFNVPNVTDISRMFYNCRSLKKTPQITADLASNVSEMFYSCSRLQVAENINLPSALTASGMFRECRNLKEIHNVNIGSAENLSRMFYGCSSLIQIDMDINGATDISNMFYGCGKLVKARLENANSVENASGTFNRCTVLRSVYADFQSCVNFSNILFRCYNLIEIELLNVSEDFDIKYCNATKEAIIGFFNLLPNVTSKTINASHTDVFDDLDASEKQIAEDKGWTIS